MGFIQQQANAKAKASYWRMSNRGVWTGAGDDDELPEGVLNLETFQLAEGFEVGFTEVDPESNFTIDGATLTVTNIHPEHTTSYVYYDFGEGYFKKNFELRFSLNVSSLWAAHAPQGIIGVSNALELANGVRGPNSQINYDYNGDSYPTPGARFELDVGGGLHVAHSYIDQFLIGAITYYCKMERIYVGGAADNIVQMTVYSDSGYTTLAQRITVPYGDIDTWGEPDFTLAEATETYRYLMLATSSKAAYSDTEVGSCVIGNVQIVSNTN